MVSVNALPILQPLTRVFNTARLCCSHLLALMMLMATTSALAQQVAGLSLSWPVATASRGQISQGFAQYGSGSATKFHSGLDITGSFGTPVTAAAAGTARVILLSSPTWANKTKCMGNVVIINHGVVSTLYAHLNTVSISDGSSVTQGQTIGTLGRSVGYTAAGLDCAAGQVGTNMPTGSEHLHFELKLQPVLGSENDLGPPNIWGYTPAAGTTSPTLSDEPTGFGYRNPVLNLHAGITALVQAMSVTAQGGGVALRHGPGTDYASLGQTTIAGQALLSVNILNTATTGCASGWAQVRKVDGSFFTDASGGSNPAPWVCMGNAGQTWVAATTTTHLVTVAPGGAGGGTITSSPVGINCGSDCSEAFAAGTSVTLTATANANSTFAGWSGGSCVGSGTCTFTVSAPVTITANFLANPVSHLLVVSPAGVGSGLVTSSPAGINCGADCSESFTQGSVVTLQASPAVNAFFAGWEGGGCSGTGSCTVTMNAATTIRATFLNLAPQAMTISTSGSGTGTVTSSPGGSCTSPCTGGRTYSINDGASVTVNAVAQSGSLFLGWSSGFGSASNCAGNTSSCSFNIATTSSVIAVFIPATAALTVNLAGSGQGIVSGSNANISCSSNCSASIATGVTQTLTATPMSGASFAGWSGVSCNGGNSSLTCAFIAYGNVSLTAAFVAATSASQALHDLNDDGKSDIIWRNGSTGQNWYWAMNGTAITAQGAITTLPLDWQIQSTAVDFDGDGKSDILLRNMTTGQPWVWFMNGNSIIGGGALPTLSDMNWTIAGTGDLNGDGKGDVVWRNTATGQNWWWALNGTSIINQGQITALPPEWVIQSTLGDFNGDGKTDILWRNMTTGQPWVWMMDGNNLIANGPLPTLSDLNWIIAGTGDLNGDGKHDVVWRNTATGANWYWALNGTTIVSQGAITTLPPEWSFQSTSADFNGDGKADILLRNMSTGQPWIWFMNGNTILNGGPLPTLSDMNWQIRIRR